jgi:hypothetical protein
MSDGVVHGILRVGAELHGQALADAPALEQGQVLSPGSIGMTAPFASNRIVKQCYAAGVQSSSLGRI